MCPRCVSGESARSLRSKAHGVSPDQVPIFGVGPSGLEPLTSALSESITRGIWLGSGSGPRSPEATALTSTELRRLRARCFSAAFPEGPWKISGTPSGTPRTLIDGEGLGRSVTDPFVIIRRHVVVSSLRTGEQIETKTLPSAGPESGTIEPCQCRQESSHGLDARRHRRRDRFGAAVRLHQRLPRCRQLGRDGGGHSGDAGSLGAVVLRVLQLRRLLRGRNGGGQHRGQGGPPRRGGGGGGLRRPDRGDHLELRHLVHRHAVLVQSRDHRRSGRRRTGGRADSRRSTGAWSARP